MKNILVIGSSSQIAQECCKKWSSNKANILLVARNSNDLEKSFSTLKKEGANSVATFCCDLLDPESHSNLILEANSFFKNKIDIVLIAHGSLPNQEDCQKDLNLTLQEFATNCTSTIAILTLLVDNINKKRDCTIAVITSVSADRGRASNYVYGAAKAALDTFCSGLRARFYKTGIKILTIKPGFVATKMTKHLDFPKILIAKPEKVANDICKAIDKKSDIIYSPKFWRLIMAIIKIIPESIFKRLKI